jgi:nitroimidazol reductase NimA-like FMN-containing flavoprotein (pyridoxamine 5'-phosphate oxidase superfamily)
MMGKLDNNQIEELLLHEIIGRIGCHADGVTYVVPISFAYDGKYVYGHTHEGMKIDIMRKNPKVCFQVDHLTNMANWKSVISMGTFEEITDTETRKDAIQKLINRTLPMLSSETVKLTSEWPFKSGDPDKVDGIIYRIALEEKSGRYESNGFFAGYAS